ncbi:MAG: NAD-dependent epimerase/dehydratase family protein [Candidatus Bathyarchaeia archaeon]
MSYGRILVTGGAGFIGSNLVDALVEKDFSVVVLDNFSTGRMENLKHHLGSRGFRLIKGDIRDGLVVKEALKGVEAVFHLAAIVSVPYSIGNPHVTREVNVDGTRRLLESCLEGEVEKIIYTSTCAVYGEAEYLPIDERHPTKPISPYAESKLEAENLCRIFGEKYGFEVVTLRLFNVYGLRVQTNQYGGVIARFIERLKSGKPPVIYGDGRQTRDFVHVSDVVKAMVLALNNGSVAGTFNIGSGLPTTINDLARLLIDIFGIRGIEPIYQEARSGDIRHSYADIRLAQNVLKFKPSIGLKEGLSNLLSQNISL